MTLDLDVTVEHANNQARSFGRTAQGRRGDVTAERTVVGVDFGAAGEHVSSIWQVAKHLELGTFDKIVIVFQFLFLGQLHRFRLLLFSNPRR